MNMLVTPVPRTTISARAWRHGGGRPPEAEDAGRQTYTFTANGITTTEDGATHGHNIVAADFGYVVDASNPSAPGGTFQSSQIACNSCHDQHGQYRRRSDGTVGKDGGPIIASGSYATSNPPGYTDPPAAGTALDVYRLLAGVSYNKAPFTGVPAAKATNTYNRTESTVHTRVAYGHATTGGHVAWGTWCATCHEAMHSSGNYVHVTDVTLGGAIVTNYNAYVKSGDMTGVAASSFTSLVPFIEGSADYATLATHAKNHQTYLNGPTGSDRVSCLSCHRAHASGWQNMLC